MKTDVSKVFKLTIINIFTIARLMGAFILPFIYIHNGSGVCAIWTICLFLTDAVDGFLARALKSSTFFGSSMDALSDKLLNFVACILLALTYSIMIPPLILEVAILSTIYNTYRLGGNVQSSKLGKIKTVVLDICVVGSFVLLSIPTLHINTTTINYIISNTPYYITLFGCLSTIFGIIALIDYKKKNQLYRDDPNITKIKELHKIRKNIKEIFRDAFDTEYYKKHKDEPILRQFYKVKGQH